MLDNLITLFVAGQETFGNLLCFLLFELTMSSKLQEEIREEISSVECPFSLNQTPKLHSLILEGFRMYPSGGATRCAEDSLIIEWPENGEHRQYLVRKGEFISFFPYAYGQDPNVWPNPTVFNPKRHVDELLMPGAPFGAGLDICPARKSTLIQMGYTLYEILKTVRLKPILGQAPGELLMATTLKFANHKFQIGLEPFPISPI